MSGLQAIGREILGELTAIRTEQQHLRADKQRLEAEIERLRADNVQLRAKNQRLEAENQLLRNEVKEQFQEIESILVQKIAMPNPRRLSIEFASSNPFYVAPKPVEIQSPLFSGVPKPDFSKPQTEFFPVLDDVACPGTKFIESYQKYPIIWRHTYVNGMVEEHRAINITAVRDPANKDNVEWSHEELRLADYERNQRGFFK